MISSSLVAVSCLRRFYFELFLWIHVGMACISSLALWKHLDFRPFEARFYILGGIGASILMSACRFVCNCFLNISPRCRQWLPRVTVSKTYWTRKNDLIEMQGACHVAIRMAYMWDVRPGQYIYLTIPAIGIRHWFQSHPFWVVAWQKEDDTQMFRLDLLVKERSGFTSRLPSGETRIACVSGPFGMSYPLDDYGTVLMFATDIGIAAHLPYLRSLREGWAQARIRTRRIVVVWEMSNLSMSTTGDSDGLADRYRS